MKYAVLRMLEEREAVTPLAGVWIEIYSYPQSPGLSEVTPLAGVWIEIIRNLRVVRHHSVTPLAGVWIEIG